MILFGGVCIIIGLILLFKSSVAAGLFLLFAGYFLIRSGTKPKTSQKTPIAPIQRPAQNHSCKAAHKVEPIQTHSRVAGIDNLLVDSADFVAIDFETATDKRSSACAVALAFVKGEEIIGTYSSLIQPPGNIYSQRNISIHGIDAEQTRSAPNFLKLWEDCLGIIIDRGVDLVAHNASFDMSVLRSSLQEYGINIPFINATCTVELAKTMYPRLNDYKLPTVASHLNIDLHHHDPLSDAIASAKIMMEWKKTNKQNLDGEETNDSAYQYWDIVELVPTPANLLINYKKQNGETSSREIVVKEYDGTKYLYAFCKLRGMNRTFKIDRLISCIDLETGESVSNVPDLLRSKYLGSVHFSINRVIEKAIDILKVMLYVGKSDGQLRLAERVILRDVIKNIAKDDRVTDDIADMVINGIEVPTLHAFKLAVGRIAKANPNNLISVQKISKKIVQTQKKVSDGEQEALDYLAKVIGKITAQA